MARRNRYNRKRRQGRFSFLYKILVFAAICGAIAVALALFFKVETVTVTGNSRYTPQQIAEAGGIQVGDNMFFLNKYKASVQITAALPYVETVRISRQLPSTLVVTVTECTGPGSIFDLYERDGKLWLLSGDGKIVDEKTGDGKQYALVKGLSLLEPQVGTAIQVPEEEQPAAQLLLTLLGLLRDKSMLSDVQTIDLSDSASVVMRYLDRFDVTFRWDADFDYKLDYLLAVVERLEINEKGAIDMTQEGKASFIPG